MDAKQEGKVDATKVDAKFYAKLDTKHDVKLGAKGMHKWMKK